MLELPIGYDRVARREQLGAPHARHERLRLHTRDRERAAPRGPQVHCAPADRGRDVVPRSREAEEARRTLSQKARTLRTEIEHRTKVGVHVRERVEQRCQLSPREQDRRVERLGRDRDEPLKVECDVGVLRDRPIGRRQPLGVGRHDQNVDVVGQVDRIRAEVAMQRREHVEHERVVYLIEMQPLPEHALGREVGTHARVELVREEPGNAAHPGIRRLRENEIVALGTRSEVALRVVMHEVRSGVVVRTQVRRPEELGRLDHLRFDVDRHELVEVLAAEQEMRCDP